MRKVKDSAAVAPDGISAEKAVDLGSETVLAGVRRQAALSAMRPQVTREQVRIEQRITYLQRKASRLPANSNGRAKVQAEIDHLLGAAGELREALKGSRPPGRPKLTGLKHVDRAIGLVGVLLAA